MTEQAPEKRQFTVPNRDELIQQIKQLDEDFEHVSLNLIKCDFNATEADIKKTFPEVNFLKVKNYNPGSFELVFDLKIDAINFIKNSYDKKILNRRFFIKMGRQQKEIVEDWACVGFVPKQFKTPYKPHNKDGNPTNPRRKPEGEKKQATQQNVEAKTQQPKKQVKKQVIKTQVKHEVKPQVKPVVQQVKEQKKQGKIIPKTEYKKPYTKKPFNKEEKQTTAVESTQTKPTNAKKVDQVKKQDKKQQKKAEKPVETVKEPETKEQDDGWTVVKNKTSKRK